MHDPLRLLVLLSWYWSVGLVLLGAAELDQAIEATLPGLHVAT